MRRVTAGALVAAAALGIASESVAYDWDEPTRCIPDLLVGWALVGAGVAAWQWRRAPAPAALLAATGITWFLGLGPATLYLHRGPLVHLLVAFAGWRPRTRLDLAAVATGYVAAVVTPLWASPGVWRAPLSAPWWPQRRPRGASGESWRTTAAVVPDWGWYGKAGSDAGRSATARSGRWTR